MQVKFKLSEKVIVYYIGVGPPAYRIVRGEEEFTLTELEMEELAHVYPKAEVSKSDMMDRGF